MQNDDEEWLSPSFNSYSHNQLPDKVADQTIAENDQHDFEFSLIPNNEFQLSKYAGNSHPPFFPIFDRDLLLDSEESDTIKVPLRRLLIEERQGQEPPSSSSSEAEDGDEAESIPPGSYCVWKPKVAKSKSTGFGSKRWKLRDLLRRSNSEGKDSLVFLTPKRKEEKKYSKSGGSVQSPGARRLIYSPENRVLGSPNRSPKPNGEIMPKRKSYLPYRQDLVAFFTTVNSFGRNVSPL